MATYTTNACCSSSSSSTGNTITYTTSGNTGQVLQHNGTGTNWNNTVTATPYTTTEWSWTYPGLDEVKELKKRVENLEKNKKEKKDMFEGLTKNLKCGRAQDVRLSIYGPAFKGEDGCWYSVDEDGEMTDVSNLLFDTDGFCYMMPVAKNTIKEGDFILHNGHWIKILDYENGCIMSAVDTFNKQIVIPTVIKSPFGFEFYTKLIQFIDFSKMPASAENPFGMMPLMLMMNSKSDKDVLPMLIMLTSAQNGDFKLDMSNPMMMYLLMKDSGESILPFLAMGTFKSTKQE